MAAARPRETARRQRARVGDRRGRDAPPRKAAGARSRRGRDRARRARRGVPQHRRGGGAVNTTLFRFILRRHRFALIACWLVPVLIALAAGLIYPTYAKEREALGRIMKIFGKVFGSDSLDILSPLGFLSLPFQHPLTLLM